MMVVVVALVCAGIAVTVGAGRAIAGARFSRALRENAAWIATATSRPTRWRRRRAIASRRVRHARSTAGTTPSIVVIGRRHRF
jgi:hypothetical protein